MRNFVCAALLALLALAPSLAAAQTVRRAGLVNDATPAIGFTDGDVVTASGGKAVGITPSFVIDGVTCTLGGSCATPGGASGDLQYNAGGSFGGIAEVDGDCLVGIGGSWVAGSCGSASAFGGTNGFVGVDASSAPFVFSFPDVTTTIGAGNGSAKITSLEGGAVTFPTSGMLPAISGTPTAGDCVKFGSATTVADAGAPCGTSSGGGSLTVTDGTTNATNVTTLKITSGGTVTQPTAGEADIALSGSSGGAWTTVTATNTSDAIAFTGITGSDYQIECSGLLAAGSSAAFQLQLGEAGGWITTGYYHTNSATTPTNSLPEGGAGAALLAIPLPVANSGTIGASWTIYLHNLSSSTVGKSAEGVGGALIGGNPLTTSGWGYYDADTNPVTEVRIITSDASNLTTGKCAIHALY